MKTQNRALHKLKNHSDFEREAVAAAEFHRTRIQRETKIEIKKESPVQPHGNDEYEQLIAEDAGFNARPMIEEAAYFIAEKRGFVPGSEISDWLQAETDVESTLRGTSNDRRQAMPDDRRDRSHPL